MMTLGGMWSELHCDLKGTCTCIYMYVNVSTREAFSSPTNQAVVTKVVENALSLIPNSTAATLKGDLLFYVSIPTLNSLIEAARTYYNSAAGTERLKTSGKYAAKCVQQRRRNRLKRVYNNI